jgi:hypothetical protein
MERHRELMGAAIERDGAAQRMLLSGDSAGASAAFAEAAAFYRQSWEVAPPASYGRLVGMLKSSVLASGGSEEDAARYARDALGDEGSDSATAAYARAIAALIVEDYDGARDHAATMRSGSDAFVRTADAIAAIARDDHSAYAAEIQAIVRDFETRNNHLTGVPIADTALMLERLAARRGIGGGVESPLLPML